MCRLCQMFLMCQMFLHYHQFQLNQLVLSILMCQMFQMSHYFHSLHYFRLYIQYRGTSQAIRRTH
jgi:hypothetical protein